MLLPRNIINDVVPSETPPLELIPPFAQELSENISNEILRRSYLWANAITTAGLQYLPGRCVHFSAGFVSANSTSLNNSQWSNQAIQSFLFGGYVLVDAPDGDAGQRILTIAVGERSIPMIINYGRFIPHGCPPHPDTGWAKGSAACWVKNKASVPSWSEGILTCRHVVEHISIGGSVTLNASNDHSSPTSATLAKIDACTIDAAIIEIDTSDFPTGLQSLVVRRPISPGEQVNFDGRESSGVSGSILRIFQCSRYSGNLFGQRVVIDCVGVKGDSGSLLFETSTSEGVGLYMGIIPDGSGNREGICQDLYQATKYFKLDLYR